MAAFTSFVAAAGLGLSAYGSYSSRKAEKAAARERSEQERRNAVINEKINKERIALAELTAVRAKRDLIRQAQAAAALSRSAQANSGAGAFSSASLGAVGSVLNEAEARRVAIDENLASTKKLGELGAQVDSSTITKDTTGASLAQAGGLIFGSSERIGKVAETLFAEKSVSPWETTVYDSNNNFLGSV